MKQTFRPAEDAQDSAVSTLTEPAQDVNQATNQNPYGEAGDPNDESQWLAGYREGDNSAADDHPFKPGFDRSQWHFRRFRPDDLAKYGRAMRLAGWQIVQKGSGIMGQAFDEWLEPYAFDEYGDGIVGKGYDRNPVTNQFERDVVLCVQPIGAYKAQQKMSALAWANYMKSRLTEEQKRLQESLGKEKGGRELSSRDVDKLGRSLNAESRTGWDALGT